MRQYHIGEEPAAKYKHRIEIIIVNAGWAITLLVTLATGYQSIPTLFKYLLWSFIAITFAVSIIFTAIPIWQKMREIKQSYLLKRKQQRLFQDFSEVLEEAKPLFASDGPYSLRDYVDNLCIEFSQNQSIHPELRCLYERLLILTGWHSTILIAFSTPYKGSLGYVRRVLDIVAMYRAASNVVRELAAMEMPDTPTLKGRSNQHRIAKGKYNHHIERVEAVLDAARKVNSELPHGGFSRF